MAAHRALREKREFALGQARKNRDLGKSFRWIRSWFRHAGIVAEGSSSQKLLRKDRPQEAYFATRSASLALLRNFEILRRIAADAQNPPSLFSRSAGGSAEHNHPAARVRRHPSHLPAVSARDIKLNYACHIASPSFSPGSLRVRPSYRSTYAAGTHRTVLRPDNRP